MANGGHPLAAGGRAALATDSETTGWCLNATPAEIEPRVARHHDWITDLSTRVG
jgi:hypothetical protein